MKKILSLTIALITVISLCFGAMDTASADEAKKTDYLDATYNTASLDGTISTREYVMDKVLPDNTVLGAAWDQSAGKLYIAIYSPTLPANFSIEIGGKTLTCAPNSVSGIDGAAIKVNGYVREIAIPISSLALDYDGYFVFTPIKLDAIDYEGRVAFTNYKNTYIYSLFHQTAQFQKYGAQINMQDQSVLSGNREDCYVQIANNKLHFYDNYTGPRGIWGIRTYAITYCDDLIDNPNVHYEFDLNVKSMPYSTPIQDAPNGRHTTTNTPRIYIAVKTGKSTQLYLNLINTVDNGLTLVCMTQDKNLATNRPIPLGKNTGEDFTLSLDWNDKYTLSIRVDGKLVATLSQIVVTNNNALTSANNVIFFDTHRGVDYGLNDKPIDFEYYNVSVGGKATAYDVSALAALSTVEVDLTKKPDLPKKENEETEETQEDITFIDVNGEIITTSADAESDNTVDSGDTTAKGCGSSLGAGAMILPTLSGIVFFVAKKKKADRRK